jgi:hypothetical protein
MLDRSLSSRAQARQSTKVHIINPRAPPSEQEV